MKKFLTVLFAFALGITAGYLVYAKIQNRWPFGRVVTLANYKEPFMWGVNTNPSPLRRYYLTDWNKQVSTINRLEAKWIRLAYDFDADSKERKNIYEDMIESANKSGVNIVLVLEPGAGKAIADISNPYQDGYDKANEVSAIFGKNIQFYQILNEIGGATIKDATLTGTKESDIDETKYNASKEWIKGAIAAIRKNDPDAYTVVDSFWTHYAVIDKLIKDKVVFDILGWNWYSDMGMMAEKKLDDGSLLMDKLETYNKPVFLLEVNQVLDNKGRMDEEKQADYISKMADWAYNTKIIKGFYVYPLFDTPPKEDTKASYLGIVLFQKSTKGIYSIGDTKKAFDTYKEVITKYSQGK